MNNFLLKVAQSIGYFLIGASIIGVIGLMMFGLAELVRSFELELFIWVPAIILIYPLLYSIGKNFYQEVIKPG
jgi:hypothetical protein